MMKRQRENTEGGGRNTVEIEPLDYFVLLPTEPVWNSALSEDRNGKNLASVSVKKKRVLTAFYTVVNLAQCCSKPRNPSFPSVTKRNATIHRMLHYLLFIIYST